jgi:hypothetical protein
MTKEQLRLARDMICSVAGFLNRFNETRANMRAGEKMAYEAMVNAYMACQNADMDIILEREMKEEGKG